MGWVFLLPHEWGTWVFYFLMNGIGFLILLMNIVGVFLFTHEWDGGRAFLLPHEWGWFSYFVMKSVGFLILLMNSVGFLIFP